MLNFAIFLLFDNFFLYILVFSAKAVSLQSEKNRLRSLTG